MVRVIGAGQFGHCSMSKILPMKLTFICQSFEPSLHNNGCGYCVLTTKYEYI